MAKQNTLKELLSKIETASDDPKELFKLDSDIRKELQTSDDLMFETLRLRDEYIKHEQERRKRGERF